MQVMQVAQEEQLLLNETAEIQKWFSAERFRFTKRVYSASDVAKLRSSVQSVPASNAVAKKLYSLLREKFARKDYAITFGCLDPVQVVHMAKYLDCIYVSGWQSSSTASTTNEPGPDFADYPMNTVPNKVDQLFRAQQFHDRKQREARSRMTKDQKAKTPFVDYFKPIIADGDTGFGGVTSVMKLIKLQIEAGAAGVHIEDQKVGAKKCGHMGGKVLVSVQEHIDRLTAARLEADVLGAETVLIARTDADSATFLDSNIDPRDHPYIAGATNPEVKNINREVEAAIAKGASPDEINKLQQNWVKSAKLNTYPKTVAAAIQTSNLPQSKKEEALKKWEAAKHISHNEARALAKSLGFGDVYFCWEAPRTREGFYRVIGGVDYCVARAHAFAPYADLIWMETATPNHKEAEDFAHGVHAKYPHQMLAYNLSPSFNWEAYLDDQTISQFNPFLGKLGFVWQFITLAGFHANALIVDHLAKGLAKDGVLWYVRHIQKEEKKHGVETLTHQKWSGAEILDFKMMAATGGSASTASMGEGVTEKQFEGSKGGHGHSNHAPAAPALKAKL